MNWNEAVKIAAEGKGVMIVGEGLKELSAYVNKGALYVRGLRESGLKSVAVDVVWFIGDMPDGIKSLCIARTAGNLNPEIYFSSKESIDDQMTILDDYLDATGEETTKVNSTAGGWIRFLEIWIESVLTLAVVIIIIFLLFPFWCLEMLGIL